MKLHQRLWTLLAILMVASLVLSACTAAAPAPAALSRQGTAAEAAATEPLPSRRH